MRLRFLIISLSLFSLFATAHPFIDSSRVDQKFSFHFQNTEIFQYHPSFQSQYSGKNSLESSEEKTASISATFYVGLKLWKGASVYYNGEISGGSGFSFTRGAAGFPNGEVYRVDNPAPKYYTARFFINQIIPLSGDKKRIGDDMNQLAGEMPVSYLSINAGKFSILDYFDLNVYSHDPRNHFFNWALMGNGAWDYPANTRGYTYGIAAELVKPMWTLRFGGVMVPNIANGSVMDREILKNHASALEFERRYKLSDHFGAVRFVAFLNRARMGNYREAITLGIVNNVLPVVDSIGKPGNTKYGFGINIEQELSKNTGFFLRAGWNDGNNQTWVFTEIDRTLSFGIRLNGAIINRRNDNLGLAFIINGISKDHAEYLRNGGYGFIIGDGNLNYGQEIISELYYSFRLKDYPLWISPDYQFILHPAYNKDRGPVSAFGIRVHIAI